MGNGQCIELVIEVWITKATDTHSEYVILLFHNNRGCVNVTRTLPALCGVCVL